MEKSSTKWKRVRTELGFTQKQVAEALGVSTNYVWMIEKGSHEPSAELDGKLEVLRVGRYTVTPPITKSNSLTTDPKSKRQDRSVPLYHIAVEPWEALELLTDDELSKLLSRAFDSRNAGALGALTYIVERRNKWEEAKPSVVAEDSGTGYTVRKNQQTKDAPDEHERKEQQRPE